MFDPDGPVASDIAWLWWAMVVLGSLAFVVFMAALVIGLRRGRTRTDGRSPSPGSLRRWVLGGGVVMPAILLTFVLGFTIAVMAATRRTAPPNALRVDVIGHQWWYEIRYPDHGVVTANELHLPVDRPIEMQLSSTDVIHSFWVPALAGKLDMLPDTTNTLLLEATETGEHLSQCAEFCGLQHAKMRLITVVVSEPEFLSWLEANAADAKSPSGPLARRGQDLFLGEGCASCHTVRGTDAAGSAGPDLTHLASRSTIASAVVERTPEALREWISNPDGIKTGALMPDSALGDDELEALLAYLDELT
jgi:cytochrome c oxidase subunit 2